MTETCKRALAAYALVDADIPMMGSGNVNECKWDALFCDAVAAKRPKYRNAAIWADLRRQEEQYRKDQWRVYAPRIEGE